MNDNASVPPAAANKSSNQARHKLAAILWRIVSRVLIAYVLLVLLMMWFESFLVYPTWQIPEGDWSPSGFAYEEVPFHSDDGTALHGWFLDHDNPQAYVLYCHGNGETVAHLGDYLDAMRDELGVAIFVFDYRGYGKSAGRPHEQGIIADGHAAQKWLAKRAGKDPQDIVLWGRSIGGAVAVQLAAELGARALILERTFSSLSDVAAYHYPWLPVRQLMRNRYNSMAYITKYQGPILQSHGDADGIVPPELGAALFDAATSHDKKFLGLPGVTHNAPNDPEYYTEVARFLARLP